MHPNFTLPSKTSAKKMENENFLPKIKRREIEGRKDVEKKKKSLSGDTLNLLISRWDKLRQKGKSFPQKQSVCTHKSFYLADIPKKRIFSSLCACERFLRLIKYDVIFKKARRMKIRQNKKVMVLAFDSLLGCFEVLCLKKNIQWQLYLCLMDMERNKDKVASMI